ncbi:glycosyltransferase family 1 protein [Mucilaginibacter sp. 14171R-50]|uniref:glycosyltransferase family 4 protein n=1 Tax=Mucilaginibacter sp. 14171R-50 TaxID=2703789 RepID=UPI00138DB551|nr:glycosyltransferase family 1 protein [Mucilaginibacter sp. 14171R-50]QHS57523.1 glycosyltransferase family 1 protein [Mucilaginibacter sp. 14171R-50]
MKYQTKRVALISEHASPLASLGGVDTGGQNVYVAQLARHLAAQGYLVDVFTRKDNQELEDVIDWLPGVRVINIQAGPAANVIKEELLQYMDEFKGNMVAFIINRHLHYSLIHANFFMSAYVAMGIKKELDIPFVVTFHALGHVRKIHQAQADKFPAERLLIEEQAVQEACHIIAECPQDMDDLIQYYNAPESKVSIIPCGFSSKEFYPVGKSTARKILGLPQNEHIILQLGRMVPRKGVDNVIRALSNLKGLEKPVKLLIVGGESEILTEECCPEFARLMRVAREHNVVDSIIFTGRKDRHLLKFYYSAADLFITTPWYEPFGITPLEAMACGTPVIGANVGGIKYSIADGETGLLVNPHDPEILADKISKVIDNGELLSRMGENAIYRVNTHFTWAKVAKRVISLYDALIPAAGEAELITGEYQAA